ncbi:LuxR C-terminal-related transcriptional regulator [Solirubrobacter ginsenosidimutans]|uniref:LuxR C-terminal-related transcriptional regulator n=1 Tax=Solirubrobacter ginsenosidimutans TaxID=490573 RepID=A0A9X3MQU2_9ACTN|nr:LuxR C-terminal-related transcriptional regulator [Solirubrobacter ginsenosidimutans]MDA0160750.1 LuxR C-terminal-related transcriptional regulator [Solirubrobacter ginsenosidimutans]
MPFELLESKLRPPRLSRHSVPREALVAQLEQSEDASIVVLCAGAGYGKTTTLAQWAEDSAHPFAWVSVDEHDNDPVVLLTYITAALDAVTAVDPGVFEALASPGASVETKLVPRLGAAIAHVSEPVVLVLDDVHAITSRECLDAIVALAGHIAQGSHLVLSTRDPVGLPLGRWRTRELSVEVGRDALRMDVAEAEALLQSAAARLSSDEVTTLVDRTEGWPAGLYLAGLAAAATNPGTRTHTTFTGNDPLVYDFLRSELIASLPDDELRFLTRTSVLDRLSGPLCDAALGSLGSAEMLERLERSNHFVISLDRDRTWYRCHHLLRELLIPELPRQEPELVSPILGRASDWCLAAGDDVAAIAYAQADHDLDRVTSAVTRLAQPVFHSGRVATVNQWLGWLREQDGIERYPAVAVIAAIFCCVNGQPAQSDHWTELAESGHHDGLLPDGTAAIGSWQALLRAFRCRQGIETMREDAGFAVATMASTSSWRPPAMALLGMSKLLLGEDDEADDLFVDAAAEARAFATTRATPVVVPVSQAERALVAIASELWAKADTHAEQAIWTTQRSRNQEAPLHALVYAVAARTALHGDRADTAVKFLVEAQRRLAGLTYAFPVPAVQARLEMAHAYVGLADHAGARTVLSEIDAIGRHVADLGALGQQAERLRSMLTPSPGGELGASALTAAELRLLPLMTTHLSYPEIGERLFLSRHTVKSHAVSIYRKLDVASRTDAIERARKVGLL